MGTLLCCGFTYWGWQEFLIGRAREFGIEVEKAAVDSLRRELVPLGYCVTSNLMAHGIGNVDALVRPPSDPLTFVVEIKSYPGIVRRWWGGLTKAGKFGAALIREPRQVRRQCRSLGSDTHLPVLWCPISSLNSFDIYGDILIVNGGVHTLKLGLNSYYQLVTLPAWVRFPSMPPVSHRQLLKERGFRWHSYNRVWIGRFTIRELMAMNSYVVAVGGAAGLQRR